MEKTIEVVDRKVFNSKHRITSLMLGRMNEVIKETQKAWIKFLGEHRGFFTSPETKKKIVDTSIEGKGKGVMGTPSTILKKIKIVEIDPLVITNVQTHIETLIITNNIVLDTNIEETCPLDINVQVEDTVPREESSIA